MDTPTPVMTTPKDLDLRDWFAAHALTGLLAGMASADGSPQFEKDARVARWAYEYADAMLRQRRPAAPARDLEDEPTDLEYATAEALNGRR